MKRFAVPIRVLAFLWVLLFACGGLTVHAAPVTSLNAEQAYVNASEVQLYLYGLDSEGTPQAPEELENDQVRVMLGDETLKTQYFGLTTAPVTYFYLLDISNSISEEMFAAVKSTVLQQAANLRAGDQIVVFTFGEDITLLAAETSTYDQLQAALDPVRPDNKKTRLYDAIARAVEYSSTHFTQLNPRKVAYVFTDGEDVYDGGTTKDEVRAKLSEEGMALYAFCTSTNEAYIDSLGELARASGGQSSPITPDTAAQAAQSRTQYVQSAWQVTAQMGTNQADNSERTLTVSLDTAGGTLSSSTTVHVIHDQTDTVPPAVERVEVNDQDELEVFFTEKVTGADVPEAYRLEDADGRTVAVKEVSMAADGYSAVLTTGTLYDGDYELYLDGVKDNSVQENEADGDAAFAVEVDGGYDKDTMYYLDRYKVWIIVGAAAVIAGIAAAALSVSRRHKREQAAERARAEADRLRQQQYMAEQQRQQQLLAQQQRLAEQARAEAEAERRRRVEQDQMLNPLYVRHIQLTVTAAGQERVIPATVRQSFVIGRGQGCALCLNDPKVSHNHCEMSVQNGLLLVRDNGSLNGTRLNGQPLTSVRPLVNGDVLELGDTRIVVTL